MNKAKKKSNYRFEGVPKPIGKIGSSGIKIKVEPTVRCSVMNLESGKKQEKYFIAFDDHSKKIIVLDKAKLKISLPTEIDEPSWLTLCLYAGLGRKMLFNVDEDGRILSWQGL